MAEEIIYTSAPKGLKQGSRGFCTVVSTAGLGANIAERLESMSGYRHAFALHDPNAALNPINFSHVTTRLAGRKLNVISRVADAGQDYSGRTNKLAHHIVVDNTASLLAGPARLLAAPSTVVTRWDGNVSAQPARALGNPQIPDTIRLTAWKAATGDGGWAGWIAEQLLASRAPVNVIFEPGTDTLALVVEVLDLVPIPQRWGITFSTYFTRLLAGTECQLRFIVDATSEATSLRNDARAAKIDLTATLPAAAGGPLVEKSRAGILQSQHPKRAAAPTSNQVARREVTSRDGTDVSDDELDEILAAENIYDAGETYRVGTPGSAAPTTNTSPPPVSRLHQAFHKDPHRSGTWMTGLLAAIVVCAVGVAAYLVIPNLIKIAQQDSVPPPAGNTSGPRYPRQQSGANQSTTTSTAKQPEVLPFDGKSPFANLKQGSSPSTRQLLLELPDMKTNVTSDPIQLLMEDHSRLICESHSESLNIERVAHASNESRWQVAVGGEPVGSLVASNSSAIGTILTWRADVREFGDRTYRRSLYKLRDFEITLTAPSNAQPQKSESISLNVVAPQLYNGRAPFESISPEPTNGVHQWESGTPLLVHTLSPEDIEITLPAPLADAVKVKSGTGDWALHYKDILAARIVAAEKANGIELTWKWADGIEKPVEFRRGQYRLSKGTIQLKCNRDDIDHAAEMACALPYEEDSPFLSEHDVINETPLLQLPNPDDGVALPDDERLVIRLGNAKSFGLELHPGFQDLIRTPGRSLQIAAMNSDSGNSDEQTVRTWRVSIVDDLGMDGDRNERRTTLAEYSLTELDAESAEYALTFKWVGSESEAFGEWLRWCPLIVSIDNDTHVFLQRWPDKWVIPPLDRAKQYVMTPNNDVWPDQFHTGNEFRDLVIPTGDDAVLAVTIGTEDEVDARETFTFPLHDANTDHVLYFGTTEPLRFATSPDQLPDASRYCLLKMRIELPGTDGGSLNCRFTAIPIVHLPDPHPDNLTSDLKSLLESCFPMPMDEQMNDPAYSNTWEQRVRSIVKREWPDESQFGNIPVASADRDLSNARKTFDRHSKSLARQLAKYEDAIGQGIRKLNDVLQKPIADPQDKTELQEEIDRWTERLSLLAEVRDKYLKEDGDARFATALATADAAAVLVKKIRFSLRMSLQFTDGIPVTVTFVEAHAIDDRAKALETSE